MMVERIDTPELQAEHDALRVAIYRLLSDLFAFELRADKIRSLSRALDAGLDPWTACLEPLRAAFKDLDRNPEAAECDLGGVFAYLFLGVGGKHSAPPYESAYHVDVSDTGQHPAAKMGRVLQQLDMHIEKRFPEPPEHISIELAAAAALIENGASPGDQSGFLAEHLHAWVPRFAQACALGDRSGFYATAARTVARFVDEDLERLRSVTNRNNSEEEDNAG